jgi:divalent metal cation (Fe/Co/Zn/Cd) transporter
MKTQSSLTGLIYTLLLVLVLRTIVSLFVSLILLMVPIFVMITQNLRLIKILTDIRPNFVIAVISEIFFALIILSYAVLRNWRRKIHISRHDGLQIGILIGSGGTIAGIVSGSGSGLLMGRTNGVLNHQMTMIAGGIIGLLIGWGIEMRSKRIISQVIPRIFSTSSES